MRNANIAKSDGVDVLATNSNTNSKDSKNSPVQEVPKNKEEDFQKGEEKDPDLKVLINNLTKTVMELVEENKIRKQQEALWYNPWGYQGQFQAL